MKRPRDTNQLAKHIADIAIGDKQEPRPAMNVHAVELGRLGGLKGGRARAKKLSKAERVRIARAGAKARWGKSPRAA